MKWIYKDVAIVDLKIASYNPRRMTQLGADAYMKSVKEFGNPEPIVLNADLTIIGGHQRIKLHKEPTIAAMVAEKQLNGEQEKRLNILLNSTGGYTDLELLNAFGFTQEILDQAGFRDFKIPEMTLQDLRDAKKDARGSKQSFNKLKLNYEPVECGNVKEALLQIQIEQGLKSPVQAFLFLVDQYCYEMGN
jgi:hypothetical protein